MDGDGDQSRREFDVDARDEGLAARMLVSLESMRNCDAHVPARARVGAIRPKVAGFGLVSALYGVGRGDTAREQLKGREGQGGARES